MEIAVRYVSKGGNTKRVADAIARTAGVAAEAIPAALPGKTDVLFLGGSVYAGGVDGAMQSFIESLSPEQVARVAVFSTAAIKKSAYPQIKKMLGSRGISVSAHEFHCRGQFTVLHRGRPNEKDLEQAAQFAQNIIKEEM